MSEGVESGSHRLSVDGPLDGRSRVRVARQAPVRHRPVGPDSLLPDDLDFFRRNWNYKYNIF